MLSALSYIFCFYFFYFYKGIADTVPLLGNMGKLVEPQATVSMIV